MRCITLDFGDLTLEAELFDTRIAEAVADAMPLTIRLQQWGNEVYGSIDKEDTKDADLGEEAPVPDVPPGGIAYTRNGNYLCVFFGQAPAWPVEYIGQIPGESWRKLLDVGSFRFLTLRFSHAAGNRDKTETNSKPLR